MQNEQETLKRERDDAVAAAQLAKDELQSFQVNRSKP